jgi:glycine betaine catabolism B
VIDDKRVNRSYTIASSPTRRAYCEISVKRDGLASKHLHATLAEGATLKVSAPAGKFVFAGHEANRVVLCAGGVGITPMMSVIRSLTDRCWIFSVRKREDIIFEAELAYLQQRFPNLHVKITLTGALADGVAWDGARGHLDRALIEGFVPGLARGPVMLCGPEPMMRAARELFVELGVPDSEVLEEAFVSPPAQPESAQGGATPVVAEEPALDGDVPNVNFQKAGKRAELPADLTVLEVAEDCGVNIPFECRSGICGQCKTRLVAGRVTMDVQDALTPADRSKGLILACQAKAVRDVIVDA